MKDALFMRIGESVTDLKDNAYRFLWGKSLRSVLVQHCTQGTPPDVFNDKIIITPLFTGVQKVLQSRMFKAATYLGFAPVALEDRDVSD